MSQDCGCRVNGPTLRATPDESVKSFIIYCPLHAAAPTMREALKKVLHQEINSREIENVLRIVEINQ